MKMIGKGGPGVVAGHNGRRFLKLGAVIVVALCMLSASACSASVSSDGVISQPESVFLVPNLNVGRVGWCVVEPSGGFCPEGPAQGPIIAQGWTQYGPPATAEGYAVTTGKVAAVSLGFGSPIPTHRDRALPDGLREVSVKVDIVKALPSLGSTAHRFRFLPLDSEDMPMRQGVTQDEPLSLRDGFVVPSASGGRRRAPAICSLGAARSDELKFVRGSAVSKVRSYRGLTGQGFLSCASNTYSWHGVLLQASILLNAEDPGAAPRALPAMRSLLGSPSLVRATGFEGELVGRRIKGGWIVVGRGTLEQRAGLLGQLKGMIRLP